MLGLSSDSLPASTPHPGTAARVALAAYLLATRVPRAVEIGIDAITLATFPDRWADLITAASYSIPGTYDSARHNELGFFDWESAAVEKHFPREGTVLVTSAGGGREARALLARGHRVVATECVGALIPALRLVTKDTDSVALHLPPDAVPAHAGPFRATIVGWGAYTHLIGRERRLEFLRGLRASSTPGAPVLLSYWQTSCFSRSARLRSSVANLVRRPLGLRPLEVGETTVIRGWSRMFGPGEVRAEAIQAGFEIAEESSSPLAFPHMVLRRPA